MGDDEDVGRAALQSISEGAGLFFVGRVCRKGLGLVTNVVLTRFLGVSQYGIYSYMVVVFGLAGVFTRLGGDKSILRYLPEYEDDTRKQNAMLTVAYLTALAASVAVAALVYLLAPVVSAYTLDDPLFVDVLRVGALVLPFNTLSKLTFAAFKALDRMEYNVVTSSIVQPLVRLVFVGGAVAIGYAVVGAVAGYVVAGVLTFVATVAVLVDRTDLGRPERPTRSESKQYYDFSVPLTFNQLGSFFYNRIDLVMVGLLLSSSAVGIYRVAILVAGVLVLPLLAFNQLFAPLASKLYQDGNVEELTTVYGVVTRWTFTISLFPGLVAILYRREVLLVFGEGFSEGALVLVLFTVAQLTNCVVGPGGYLLMMTDHQYVTMANQLVSGGLNAALNYVLIVTFGLPGAAIATASVLTGINVLRVVEVWYFEGIVPYDRSYLKPVLAGGVAAALLYAASLVTSGYTLLVAGGAVGGLGFLAALAAFGFEREEKAVLREFVGAD